MEKRGYQKLGYEIDKTGAEIKEFHRPIGTKIEENGKR